MYTVQFKCLHLETFPFAKPGDFQANLFTKHDDFRKTNHTPPTLLEWKSSKTFIFCAIRAFDLVRKIYLQVKWVVSLNFTLCFFVKAQHFLFMWECLFSQEIWRHFGRKRRQLCNSYWTRLICGQRVATKKRFWFCVLEPLDVS